LPVRVPPLRERLDDLEALFRHFWGAGAPRIDATILESASARRWRGNVRELRNFVERARALGGIDAIAPLLTSEADREGGTSRVALASGAAEKWTGAPSFDQSYRTFRRAWKDFGDREFVRHALSVHEDVTRAARAAGIDASYLYKLIRRSPR
jgi:DNA-binding NtrC family response regulator